MRRGRDLRRRRSLTQQELIERQQIVGVRSGARTIACRRGLASGRRGDGGLVHRGWREIRIAAREQSLRVDQFLPRVHGTGLAGPRVGRGAGGRRRQFDRCATVYGRFDRQVGERLKDGARRSFHSFEPRKRFVACKRPATEGSLHTLVAPCYGERSGRPLCA